MTAISNRAKWNILVTFISQDFLKDYGRDNPCRQIGQDERCHLR